MSFFLLLSFSTLISTLYCRTMFESWWTIEHYFWHTRMVHERYWSNSRFYSWIRWWHIWIRLSSM